MEQDNIQYLTPEQAQNIDPSLIDFVTLSTGTIIKVQDQPTACEFQEEICDNKNLCPKCGGYRIQQGIDQNYQNVFRAGKNIGDENTEQINAEVEAQPQAEGNEQEVLRGFDGKPLLNDFLTGGEVYDGQPQYQENEYQPEGEGEIPQGQENYDDQYGLDGQYERTIKDIAKEMGLGDERIRQLRKSGIKKLKQRCGKTLETLL